MFAAFVILGARYFKEKNLIRRKQLQWAVVGYAVGLVWGGFLFTPPALPRQIQEVADPDPAQHVIEQRVLLDEHARSQTCHYRMHGKSECNPGGGYQSSRAPARQRERGEIGHVGTGGQFKQ